MERVGVKGSRDDVTVVQCIAFMSLTRTRNVLTSYIVDIELLSALLLIQAGLNNLCCICKKNDTLQFIRAQQNKLFYQTPARLLRPGNIFL